MINKLEGIITNTKPDSVYNLSGYTLQELLSNFYKYINECIELVNKNEDNITNQNITMNNFIEYMKNEGVPPIIIETINNMYNDGRLTELFNRLSNNVIDNVNNNVQEFKSKLETQIQENTNYFTTKNKINSIFRNSKMEFLSLFNKQDDWKKGCWLTPEQEQGDWTFTNNSFKPSFEQLNTHGVNIMHKYKFIQDGEIGVTIKGYDINSIENNGICINFRGNDRKDYFTCLVLFNLREIWLGKVVNGEFTKAKTISFDTPQILPQNGENLNLSIRFIGTRFSVFFNGSALFNEEVSSYFSLRESNGLFGFGIYNGSTKIDTYTKNIEFINPWIKTINFNSLYSNIEKVLSVGDSITYGAGVDTSERWTTLFLNELKKYNKTVVLDNVAVSGSTLNQIFTQVTNNILNGYDVVTILGGTNNARIDIGTSVDDALSDLRLCIWQTKGNGAIPIVGTCLPIDRNKNTSATNYQSLVWLNEFNNGVRRLCSKENIICVDFYNGFNNELSLLQGDLIHPNAEGHLNMYNTLISTLF